MMKLELEKPYGVVHRVDHGDQWPGTYTNYVLTGKFLQPVTLGLDLNLPWVRDEGATVAWIEYALSEGAARIPVKPQNQREVLNMTQEQYRNYRSLLHRITKERVRGRLKSEKDWPAWAEIEKMAREASTT